MSSESKRLVVGDDGSAAADVVWEWIDNHAWPEWHISVVTAQQPPSGAPDDSQRSRPHPWDPPEPRRLLAAQDITHVEHLVAEADPRAVLDSFTDSALMAIGPRGKGVLKRFHIGSTAEWLVSADRPLTPLVVVRSARSTRKVLLCVDGSVHAQRAAQTLVGLPWVGETQVTILGVVDAQGETERGVEEAANLLASHGVTRVNKRLISALPHTATFDVRSTILNAISEEDPDLVVMGTRGVGGIRRAALGSTASTVLRHAPCSVLIAREPDDATQPLRA